MECSRWWAHNFTHLIHELICVYCARVVFCFRKCVGQKHHTLVHNESLMMPEKSFYWLPSSPLQTGDEEKQVQRIDVEWCSAMFVFSVHLFKIKLFIRKITRRHKVEHVATLNVERNHLVWLRKANVYNVWKPCSSQKHKKDRCR